MWLSAARFRDYNDRVLELSDQTHAALEAGIRETLRELADSATRETKALMAQSRGDSGGALRQGLRGLRSRLPEHEAKLFALHLDLGVYDAAAIGERVAKEIRQVVHRIAESLAKTFRGAERVAARRAAIVFEADVGTYTSGTVGRALVAVERHRRQSQTAVEVGSEREPLAV